MTNQSSHVMSSADVPNLQSMIAQNKTIERRLFEAAQFAHAIGDAQAAQQLEILEGHRPDEQDDDEYDAEETHHHASGAASSTTYQHTQSVPAQPIHPTSSDPMPGHTWGCDTRPTRSVQVQRRFSLTGKRDFLDQLPPGQTSGHSDYVYKGIQANPPDVVKRGTQRGNHAQLHRKAWLEVSDQYHRYGKNLRYYYRHWESLGCPTNMFFDWLDSMGEASGRPLPEIHECPRAQLDSDTVLYITDRVETEKYALTMIPDGKGRGRVVDNDMNPVISGPDGWIFVLRDNRLYGAQKITCAAGHLSKERFHHSSFFGGKAVAAAGIFITDSQGFLTRLYPHSGHYRPRESHMQRVLFFLHHEGVDLRTFDVDMQQILHVAREKDMPKTTNDATGYCNVGGELNPCDTNIIQYEKKKKKVESLFLTPAVLVACFLAHKARLIGGGFFEQIHEIRTSNVTTTRQVLDFIRNGG